MIPLRDDVRTRSAPIAVIALGVANVAVFLLALRLTPGDAAEILQEWSLVPREFLRGAARPESTPHFVWLTPLTSMFLHGSLLHLAGNLLYLWIFGSRVEDLLGHARFLVFYFACGLAAAVIHVAADPSSYVPAVGASGAISGLLGAYAVSYPTGRLRLAWPRVRIPAILFLGLWIAIQVLSGVGSYGRGGAGVAWWAHVGGFVAGAALARSMWVRKPTRSRLRI
jgi:membrane associated rhomboid family serine protease